MSEWFQGITISRLVSVGVVAKWVLRSDRLEVVRLGRYDVLWKWWFHVSPNQRLINLSLSNEGLARGGGGLPRRRRKQSRRHPGTGCPGAGPGPDTKTLKKVTKSFKKVTKTKTDVPNRCPKHMSKKKNDKKVTKSGTHVTKSLRTFFLNPWARRGDSS